MYAKWLGNLLLKKRSQCVVFVLHIEPTNRDWSYRWEILQVHNYCQYYAHDEKPLKSMKWPRSNTRMWWQLMWLHQTLMHCKCSNPMPLIFQNKTKKLETSPPETNRDCNLWRGLPAHVHCSNWIDRWVCHNRIMLLCKLIKITSCPNYSLSWTWSVLELSFNSSWVW